MACGNGEGDGDRPESDLGPNGIEGALGVAGEAAAFVLETPKTKENREEKDLNNNNVMIIPLLIILPFSLSPCPPL